MIKDKMLVTSLILVNKDGELLIQKIREGKANSGLWEFPGGKVEASESTLEGLFREIKEEVDVDLTNYASELEQFSFNCINIDGGNDVLVLFYFLKDWTGEAKGAEGQDIKWVNPEQLSQMPFIPENKKVISYLRAFL